MAEEKINKRTNKCPDCGGTLFYREGNLIICLNHDCDFKVEMKRETDKDIRTFAQLKTEWA